MVRRATFSLSLAACVLAGAVNVRAQTWLPGKGKATFSIGYQWLQADNHVSSSAVEGPTLTPFEEWVGFDFPSKTDPDSGTSQSMAVVFDADVGVTEKLALFGGLMFVAPRYIGAWAYPTVPGDDGNFHGTFQDARIGARYAAVDEGPWTITPFTAFLFPTHDYPVYGHSAPGAGLNELQVGASVGRLIDIGHSPRLWLQGTYYYSFIENPTDDVTIDRSNLLLDLGYFVNERVSVNVTAIWQYTHGGVEWSELTHPLSFEEVWNAPHLAPSFHAHDRAPASRDWHLGGGASVQITEAVEVYANLNSMLWGENTHDAFTVNFGVSVGFQAFGKSGLGIWEAHDDEDADLDDWLLEDLEREDASDEDDENDENKKKPTGKR